MLFNWPVRYIAMPQRRLSGFHAQTECHNRCDGHVRPCMKLFGLWLADMDVEELPYLFFRKPLDAKDRSLMVCRGRVEGSTLDATA